MEDEIFRLASKTYYWSTTFFPTSAKNEVTKLYTFVRVADDFVDSIPQDPDSFYELKSAFFGKKPSSNKKIIIVIKNIEYLIKKYDFDRSWPEAFLEAMESDLTISERQTIDDSIEYIYGSAAVIGLMMAKILGLPNESFEAAKMLGMAMQWINFIRDIEEDNRLGRSYFPQTEFKKFGLKNLEQKTAKENPGNFKKFIQYQLDRYKKWQAEAEAGYKFIPKKYLVPIKTASDMYNWTAAEIEKDPFIVYEKKVKPTKEQVVEQAKNNNKTLK